MVGYGSKNGHQTSMCWNEIGLFTYSKIVKPFQDAIITVIGGGENMYNGLMISWNLHFDDE